MAVSKVIPCRCDPDKRLRRLELDDIQPFQGSLKSLDSISHERLAKSMRELGFSFPEFVWRHPDGRWLCIDGHQRLAVLAAEGWTVDGGVPVVEIEAADEQEAAKKLLVASSSYGKVEPQGLYEFTEAHGLLSFDLPDLPGIDMDAYAVAFGDQPQRAPQPPLRLDGGCLTALIDAGDVRLLEEALRATGKVNRAEAMAEICRAYLGAD